MSPQVFSSKRYTSDDLANGCAPRPVSPAGPGRDTPVGILKHSPHGKDVAEDVAEAVSEEVADDGSEAESDYCTPVAPRSARAGPGGRGRASKSQPRRSRSRTRAQGQDQDHGQGRVSKHASFTEELQASPWKSASESLLAALALATSPPFRKRAKQAEQLARRDETVRHAVQFYKESGEWWK